MVGWGGACGICYKSHGVITASQLCSPESERIPFDWPSGMITDLLHSFTLISLLFFSRMALSCCLEWPCCVCWLGWSGPAHPDYRWYAFQLAAAVTVFDPDLRLWHSGQLLVLSQFLLLDLCRRGTFERQLTVLSCEWFLMGLVIGPACC
jgi:hypothetical protein